MWDNHKRVVLSKLDKSYKGSIDEPVKELVGLVNSSNDFFTTSSCSGRIILINETSREKRKNKSQFLFVSHDFVQEDKSAELHSISRTAAGHVFFKLEPLIIHIECRSMEFATRLLHVIKQQDQFKHTSIVSVTNEKLILSIRGIVKLEIPLVYDGQLLSNEEQIRTYIRIANERMKENFNAIDTLTTLVREGLLSRLTIDSLSPTTQLDLAKSIPQLIETSSEHPHGEFQIGFNQSESLAPISILGQLYTISATGKYVTHLESKRKLGIRAMNCAKSNLIVPATCFIALV